MPTTRGETRVGVGEVDAKRIGNGLENAVARERGPAHGVHIKALGRKDLAHHGRLRTLEVLLVILVRDNLDVGNLPVRNRDRDRRGPAKPRARACVRSIGHRAQVKARSVARGRAVTGLVRRILVLLRGRDSFAIVSRVPLDPQRVATASRMPWLE